MGKDPLFHADHVDFREFKTLGAVEGHQGDRVALQLFFLFVFDRPVAENDFVQEPGQCRAVRGPTGGIPGGGRFPGWEGRGALPAVFPVVFGERIDDLLDGIPPRFPLFGFAVAPVDFLEIVTVVDHPLNCWSQRPLLQAGAGFEDGLHEPVQSLSGGGWQVGAEGRRFDHVPDWLAGEDAGFDECFGGSFPDAPGRPVEDPQGRGIVAASAGDPQPGENVLDFLAVEEGAGADEDIGQFVFPEPLFEEPGLFVGPEENGKVPGFELAGFEPVADCLDSSAGFGSFVGELQDDGSRSAGSGRFESLVVSHAVEADQGICELQDRVAAAVVDFETDCFGLRPVFPETENVFDFGSAPAVNRLIIVPDHAEIAVGGGEGLHDPVLAFVGILVFIDEDLVKASGFLSENSGKAGEELVDQQQEVVEVDGTESFEFLLIAAIGDGGEGRAVAVGEVHGGGGIDRAAFPGADLEDKLGGRKDRFGNLDVPKHAPRQAFLLAARVDRIAGGIAEMVDVPAEDPDAERMESRDEGFESPLGSGKSGQAILHFAGGLVGERHGEDPVGRCSGPDQFGDAIGDDTGLARPGACEDQQRTGAVLDGGFLAWVQTGHSGSEAGGAERIRNSGPVC